MAETAYTKIKNQIKTILDGVDKLQEVKDDPSLEFSGYPAATIIPSEQESDYETESENLRVYSFDVHLYQEVQAGGLSAALDTLYDLADDVFDAFDKDSTIRSLSLPTGYTAIAIEPVSAGWEEVPDKKLVVVNTKIRVKVSVDISE